ncbi:MAG: HD domain-containing protein [Anaerolineales bacterium]|nr:HD domain-containing protein [Anaerolineales bacterium]
MPSIETARSWYLRTDPVHGFDHILRVFRMAEQLAEAEGADIEIVRAAALLHDVDGSQQPALRENEGSAISGQRKMHQHSAANFARQILQSENWAEARIQAVEHCIRAHRFRDEREQPQTIEAQVLFDADKLDAIGAIGAVRSIGYAVLAEQPLHAKLSQQFLETGEKEPNEPHTPYHEHLFKLSKLKDRMFTASGRTLAEERHNFLEAFFEQWQAELRSER